MNAKSMGQPGHGLSMAVTSQMRHLGKTVEAAVDFDKRQEQPWPPVVFRVIARTG